jgi:putative Mg2+ transporter-C (MgtC) family protein
VLDLSLSYLPKLVVALGLGAAIGLERQWRQRRAGLRTNALVALGSALFVMLNDDVLGHSSDPTRIAAQVVSGIGFLGAGVILRDGLSVRGLNTAATLWCSAAVGVLAGFGLTLKAVTGAIAVIVANVVLRPLAQRINRAPAEESEEEIRYEIRAKCESKEEAHVRHLILQAVSIGPLTLKAIDSEDMEEPGRTRVTAKLEAAGKQHALLEQLIGRLGIEPGVFGISWSVEPTGNGEA